MANVAGSSRMPLGAAAIGFLLSTLGGAIASVGFLMMWAGIAFGLTGGQLKRWGGGFIGAAILAAVGATIGGNVPQPEPSSRAAAAAAGAQEDATASPAAVAPERPAPAPPLEVTAWRWYREHGYFHVTGTVKNTTTKPIDNIMAVARFFTKDGTFVKSDDALVEYRPLMPGQDTPFTVMTSVNPLIERASIEFKQMFGPSLDFKDSSRK